MVNYRAQVTLTTTDNVAANFITNTLHFSAVDDTDLPDIETALTAMYNGFRPFMSTLLNVGGHKYKWYNLEDPVPRAPVRETTWTFSSALSGTPLPPEVALCVSFQADKISGENQARRRNRIYVGPFSTAMVGTSGRVDSSAQASIRNAAQGLLTASAGAADWTWGIFSTLEIGLAEVADGWVDNEFDTQRRRGRPATARNTFT